MKNESSIFKKAVSGQNDGSLKPIVLHDFTIKKNRVNPYGGHVREPIFVPDKYGTYYNEIIDSQGIVPQHHRKNKPSQKSRDE